MNHSAGYMKSSDQQWLSIDSEDDSLPNYLCEPLEEAFSEEFRRESQKGANEDANNRIIEQTDVIIKDTASEETLIQITVETCISDKENKPQNKDQEARNTFWISVSGYESERAYIVYRFFCDIGHIVSKCFTETNLMYLKYFSMLDCQIALSYNGQRIGYGGDISVKVKAENPVTEGAIIDALEKCSYGNANTTGTDTTSTSVTIEIGEYKDQHEINPHELEIGQKKDLVIIHKRVSILQWFKEKLSYMFYFY